MKTTVDLPDELLRAAKASAARSGSSLKEVLSVALRDHLAAGERVRPGEEAWRRSFGSADPRDVRAVDAILEEDLEKVDLESWS